ncbi:hypothetical protein [Desulfonatronum thioautotrophicum]|uniref:hypothetical protein n=1 Tax=Desulfonatronum thioautotrophicum TaxID=617001 RepID=UPI0005EB2EE9|nr:hypothetical protein [Desulfonatronum thioautotrophicum]
MEQEKKENWSVRVSGDIKNRLSALRQNFESGEAFIRHALEALDIAEQGKTSIDFPVRGRAEVLTFAKTAQSMVDQMQALVTITEAQREQAKTEILEIKSETDKKIAAFAAEISHQKTAFAEQNKVIADLQKQNFDLENSLKTSIEHAESIEELKAVWKEKESELNTKIAELNSEANRSKELEKEIFSLKEKFLDAVHKQQLAEQKATLIEKIYRVNNFVNRNVQKENNVVGEDMNEKLYNEKQERAKTRYGENRK